jgi:septum site-determining protein MinD
MGISIVITSGKGGTGKTTASAAIASCLAALGKKTLCIDADMVLRNLDISLGLSEIVSQTFTDVIEGRCSLQEAAMPHPSIENLFFLGAPMSMNPEEVDPLAMQTLIRDATALFDYCIIDSPAGLGPGFRLAASGCDMAIVVTTADDSSCRDSQRTVSELMDLGISDIRAAVNRVNPTLLKKVSSNIDTIVDWVGARLIGIIPDDLNVTTAANLDIALVLFSNKGAARAFLHIAMRLEGRNVPLMRIR